MSDVPTETRRRVRRKDARPGEIAAAALKLFAERGFAATRLEDVAAAAGIGKGTIYLYFGTKEELFEAVVRQQIVPRLEAAEALLGGHTGSAADLLRGVARIVHQVIDSDLTAIPKLIATEAGNFPQLAQFYVDRVVKRGIALLARILAIGIERGEFRAIDPMTAVPLFIGPILMIVLWKHSLGRHTDIKFQPQPIIEAHVETLLRGLAPEAAP
jgi:AcrR family transcriptional regulator